MFGNHREGLPLGWHLVSINGKHLYGKNAKVALNVLKKIPSDSFNCANQLTQELLALFESGLPNRARVRLVRNPDIDLRDILKG